MKGGGCCRTWKRQGKPPKLGSLAVGHAVPAKESPSQHGQVSSVGAQAGELFFMDGSGYYIHYQFP